VDKKTFSAHVLRAFAQAGETLSPEERARRECLLPLVDDKVSSVRVYARKPEEA
jgi:hypothetical protein